MHYKMKNKIIVWILSICLVITLIPDIGYATEDTYENPNIQMESAEDLESEGQGEPDVLEPADELTPYEEEQLEAVTDPAMEGLSVDDVVDKTETTTTFDVGNGMITKVIHGGAVRFENEEGDLIDYDPSLIELKDGEKTDLNEPLNGYEYRNNVGDKKQYLPETLGEKTPIIMEYGKKINEIRNYTYDQMGNLTQSIKTDNLNDGAESITTYEYDPVGNRTSMTVDGVETRYYYNGLNQLETAVASDIQVNYSYDGRGNQIKEEAAIVSGDEGSEVTTVTEIVETNYALTGEMTSLIKTENGVKTLEQTNVGVR